jgi:hypothetical protein
MARAKRRGKRGDARYRDWHWGNPATHVIDVDIPGVPDDQELIECGLLTELHIDPRPDLPLPYQRADSMDEAAHFEGNEPERFSVIRVKRADYNNNHLIFDPAHPRHRLYIVLSPSSQDDAAQLWQPGKRTTTLDKLAAKAGGHHDDGTYPDVPVQELGRLYFATYFTHKQGDDPASKYIHRMGEEGGIEPILAVDKHGRLWIAGGSYTCPNAGITH